MPRVAEKTGYFFNSSILTVALIVQGVRVPAGTWLRVANALATPEQVEEMLAAVFPGLRGKVLAFVSLSSETEVRNFERHP
jgi:hypothetical protein